MSQREVKVAVAGATGTVGQRFIVLLASHPYFRISSLNASARSAGKLYKDIVRWKQTSPIPKVVMDMTVRECRPEDFEGAEIVFSGLDSDAAGDIGTPSPDMYYESILTTPRVTTQRKPFEKLNTPSSRTLATSDEIPSSPSSFPSSTLPTLRSSPTRKSLKDSKRVSSSRMRTARQRVSRFPSTPSRKRSVPSRRSWSRRCRRSLEPDIPVYLPSTSSTTSYLTSARRKKRWNGN